MGNLNAEISFEDLISFIREEIGEYNMGINRETLIEDDLGVTGDEAIELIQNFSKKFNLDIKDFVYSKYFYPEPSIFSVNKSIHPITLENLYTILKTGKLE